MITKTTTTKKKKTTTKTIRFTLTVSAVLIMLTAATAPVFCEENVAVQGTPAHESVSLEKMGRKAKRGVSNILMGWSEIPQGIDRIGKEHGVGAAATLGLLHGAGRAIQRTAAGVFDILTFPIDTGSGFGTMIESGFDNESASDARQANES